MKHILASLFLFIYLNTFSQSNPDANQRRQLVENNLTPEVIYGDSVLHLNLEKQMAAYNIKGVSIAVIKNYKLDWAKGYGWADVQEKRPVTTETRFQAASISKSLNSLGVLKLVQQHKIDLDADINTYLKTWKFPYDSLSNNKKITVRNLLSHTAGLTVHGFRGYETTDTLPGVVQILNGQKPANSPAIRSAFAPSTRFQYSGGGTTISQLIIKDITGMPYDEYMKKTVLQPIGMTNSSYTQPPTDTKNLTTAYYRNGGAVKGKYHVYPEQAAAGLWTTPTDLAKYIIENQLGYEGKSSKVLSPDIMKQRMTPYIDSSVALGVFLLNKDGNKWFSHNGGNEGFVCTYYGSLKGGDGVVIMTNGDNFAIISELVNSVASVYKWTNFFTPTFKKLVALPRDTMQAYVGNYLLMKDTFAVKLCGDQLCITQNNQPPGGFKMLFTSMSEASVKEVPGVSLKFLYNGEGKVDVMELNEGGGKMKCVRIK
ncbi:MAG: serine hydrolase domain-containing protein [Chitinophagaceae bacterium]